MVSKKLDLQPMGAFLADIDNKAQELVTKAAELRKQDLEESCCECGGPGGHGDGEFCYCAEHLPPDFYAARDAAQAFTAKMRAEGKPWPPKTNNYRGPSQGS